MPQNLQKSDALAISNTGGLKYTRLMNSDTHPETLKLGTSDVVVRVYDKTAEIAQQSEKIWLFDLWGRKENVWRVEFPVCGPRLKKAGIRILQNLRDYRSSLLRDPLGYVWRDILRWEERAADEEPLVLDAPTYGSLVHAIFQDVTRTLEAGPGIVNASENEVQAAARAAVERIALEWEERYPVPPKLIWHRHLQQAERAVPRGFAAEFGDGGPGALAGQRSLTEVPFGQTGWREGDGPLDTPPWNIHAPVQIPDTRVTVNGRIDRLDLAGNGDAAAVVDYKTGKLPKNRIEVRGGKEVQRCLYGFAVTVLLGGTPVDVRLVYPFDDKALTLENPAATLTKLAGYIELGRQQLLQGLALPGEGTEDRYNDLRFALPGDAKDRYFRDKGGLFRARLGELVDVWSLA